MLGSIESILWSDEERQIEREREREREGKEWDMVNGGSVRGQENGKNVKKELSIMLLHHINI